MDNFINCDDKKVIKSDIERLIKPYVFSFNKKFRIR